MEHRSLSDEDQVPSKLESPARQIPLPLPLTLAPTLMTATAVKASASDPYAGTALANPDVAAVDE